MIDAGDDTEFQRFKSGQGRPPRIEQPPFYAVHLLPLTRKNMGGVQTDRYCRVLSREGVPISGLYAVGELSGFAAINGTSPLEGTFLGPCVVTGRVAGRTAARESRDQTPAPAKAVETGTKSNPPAASAATSCIDCHYLNTLTNRNRPGYTHFEYAHRQILEKNLNCVTCHLTLFPYKPRSHQTDWGRLIVACRTGHLPGR